MITIRPVITSDADAIFNAYVTTASTPGLLVSYPDEITAESVLNDIQQLQNQKGYFVVALNNSVLVGHAYVSQMGMKAVCHIYRLTTIVHPGYTGKGIGHAMLVEIHKWASNNSNCRKIELLVRAENKPAIRLYKRLGYVEEGLLRDRVKDIHGKFHNDICMAYFPYHGST